MWKDDPDGPHSTAQEHWFLSKQKNNNNFNQYEWTRVCVLLSKKKLLNYFKKIKERKYKRACVS